MSNGNEGGFIIKSNPYLMYTIYTIYVFIYLYNIIDNGYTSTYVY